jgi:hypothetical protein
MKNPGRPDGWLLLGVALLVAFFVALTVKTAVMQARIVEAFWAVTPHTSLVIPNDQPRVVFSVVYEHHVEILLPGMLFALLCVSWIIASLWSASRASQVRLTLVALPLIVPMLLTLRTAMLTRRWTQDTLEDIHRWISDEKLIGIDDCFGTLEPCSRLLAFDTVFTLAPVLILGATTLLLMPAMVEAYRAGARGRVGKGWSRAAIVCFLLGAAALASTQTHRLDRAQVLTECTERKDPRNEHWLDAPPVDLHGIEVAPCMPPPAWAHIHELYLGRTYGVLENGDLWRSHHIPERVEPGEVFNEDDWDRNRGTTPVLYVDERVTPSVLENVLEPARSVGIDSVLLIGTSTISGELRTIGPWQRRVQCGLELVRLD